MPVPQLSPSHGILVTWEVRVGRTWIISSISQRGSTGTETFFDSPEVTQPRSSSFPWDTCYATPKVPLPSGPRFLSNQEYGHGPFRHFQLWMLQIGKSPHISHFSETNSG